MSFALYTQKVRRSGCIRFVVFVPRRFDGRLFEDLIKLWLGHSKETVIDFYAGGLQSDLAWREVWCERVGLGFGLHWATNIKPLVRAKGA
jgi:hypothetical protein